MPRQSYQRALRPLLRGGAAVLLVAALVVLPSPPSALAAMPSGNQLKLDGANDYANIADNTSLDLGDQEGEDFTIEAFFYVPDETSETNQVIFYKGSAYTLTINFNTATADAIFTNIYTSPVTSSQLLNSTDLATGWHHVAVVYDNEWSETYDRLAIYLDGAEFASSTAFEYTPGIYASTNLLSVGANSGGVPFAGWLDEARFSDVVRYSGAYTVPTSEFVPDASTRALWHFNDAPCASSFSDSSGKGNTLSAQNGATTGLQGAASPSLQFSSATYSTAEGSGSAVITVTRTGDPLPSVGVNHTTSDGTATAGADYTDSDGTLGFSCGDMEQTFSVPIATDALVEGAETVALGLDTPTGGASLGSPYSATLTIEDQDLTPPDTSITGGPSGLTNDATPSFTFASTEGGSTFECRIDGAAFTPCTSPHTTLTLNDGAHTFYVRAIDTASNPDPSPASRSFTVDTQPPNTVLTGGPTGATNDATPEFEFTSYDGGSTFECRVDAGGWATCTSPHETAPLLDGAHGFNVRAIDDAGNVDPTPAGYTFTVDTAPPAIRFSQASAAFGEADGIVELTVTRAGYAGLQVAADVAVSGGTATGGTDFTFTPGVVTFEEGDTSETISLGITNDMALEGPETIQVALSAPGGGAVLGVPSTTTVTIEASDQQPDALISLKAASGYIGDGVYNTTGADQTKLVSQVRGKKRVFYVRVSNDGNVANTFKVKGTTSPRGASVKYFLGTTATNITTAMLSPSGYGVTLDPGLSQMVRVEIRLKATAVVGAKKAASVTAAWTGDRVIKDVAKAVVKVRA